MRQCSTLGTTFQRQPIVQDNYVIATCLPIYGPRPTAHSRIMTRETLSNVGHIKNYLQHPSCTRVSNDVVRAKRKRANERTSERVQ